MVQPDSPVIRILHLVQEFVELVLAPDWFEDFFAVQVIADVRIIFVPFHWNVAHRVADVLRAESQRVEEEGEGETA